MTWFKFLASGAVGPFSRHRWPPPDGSHKPGEWVTVDHALDPCRSGLHLCRTVDLPFWLHEELYTVDVDGPVVEYESFVLARRARLVRLVAWDRRAASGFSRFCARRVRDLAAESLARSGRRDAARRLLGCTMMDEMQRTAGELVATGSAPADAVAGYLADAVSCAGGVDDGSGWASAAATTAFIAAATAHATAGEEMGPTARADERLLQATWLTDHALQGW